MKKQIFTLVMMLALVIVAGSAWGQTPGTNNYPYKGGTYSYTLDGITLTAAGRAVISHSATGWTISNINGNPGNYTVGADITYPSGPDQSLSFDIEYADDASTAVLTVTVYEGTCFNFIEFTITPQDRPTIALKIETNITDNPLCLAKNSTPLTDNTDAVTDGGPHTNTIIFTVTPDIDNIPNGQTFAYSYEITIDDLASIFDVATGVYSISPAIGTISKTGITNATLAPDTYTVTFATKSGVGSQAINGILNSGSLTVATTSGTVSANATYGAADVDKTTIVNIGAMPSIGTFTIE